MSTLCMREIPEGAALLSVYPGKHADKLRVIVDSSMLPELMARGRWCVSKVGLNSRSVKRYYFVARSGPSIRNRRGNLSHKMINLAEDVLVLAGMPRRDGFVPDHVNGDTGDNRVCNVRWAAYGENARNRVALGSSPLPGTGIAFRHRCWFAMARFGGKSKYIGKYRTDVEAYRAYRQFAEKMGVAVREVDLTGYAPLVASEVIDAQIAAGLRDPVTGLLRSRRRIRHDDIDPETGEPIRDTQPDLGPSWLVANDTTKAVG